MFDGISARTNGLIVALGKVLETIIPGFIVSSQNPAIYAFNGDKFQLGVVRKSDDIDFDLGFAGINVTNLFNSAPKIGFNLPLSGFDKMFQNIGGGIPTPIVSKWINNVVWKYIVMATGGAPLLIGLAPVTITLILASLYSLMWYYVVLPIGTAVFANNQNNFDTSEEQEKFKKNSFDFLQTIGRFHVMLAVLGSKVMFQKGTSGRDVLQEEVSKGLISNIVRSEFGWVAKILALSSVLIALGTSFSELVSLFLKSHYVFLLIPFVLSIIGLFERHIGIIMFYLNSFAGLVWLLLTQFVDWIINW